MPVYKSTIVVMTALAILTTLFTGTVKAGPVSLDTPLSLQAGIHLSRAQTLFGQGEIQKAITVLASFVCPDEPHDSAKGCTHPYLFFTLGNFYVSLAKAAVSDEGITHAHKQAIQNYKSALRTTPNFSEAWLNLAAVCYREESHEDAAQAFEKGYLCDETPKAVHLYYAAICHFQSNNSPKALKLFAMLEQCHPDPLPPAWRELLIHVLFSMDRHKDALPHIELLANTAWPDRSKNRQEKWQEILVNQYLSLDMDKKALAYTQNLTRNAPLAPKWWKTLSHVYLKHNQLEKGLSSLIVYSFLTPLTPEEKMLAADLYFSLNIPDEAANLYESLVTQDQGQPQKRPLKKLIQARAMACDPAAALKWIDTALIDPPRKQLLTKKEVKELHSLKEQLLQILKFYAAADPVLSPSFTKLHTVIPD